MIMTAEKSHCLPSASWRTRRAGGVIQSESEDLRSRRLMSKGRSRWMSQLNQTETVNSAFLCPLVLFRPSVEWMMPPDFLREIFTQSTA